jgi:hypothetical protein
MARAGGVGPLRAWKGREKWRLRPPGFTEQKNSRRHRSLYPPALRKKGGEGDRGKREIERGEDDLAIPRGPRRSLPPEAPPLRRRGQEVRDMVEKIR